MHSETISMPYLTSLLNSNTLYWLIRLIANSLSKKGFEYRKTYVEQLPIPVVTPEKQDEIGKYTLNIQSLYEKLDVVKTPLQKKEIQQRITLLEKEVNNKIYELYELTPGEIQLIEDELQ